ncbi:GNAT family N-acetyltransferase [Sphingomonas crusticola]|uniref:GNAT family N-acetyltransferase n=1 Tax=Sphingomonas crusticola TaxID=1697973 RepID=UPI000E28852D|nr:GNAT family N-acetyltransferase [Sphingomonas crusticola]
MATDAGWRIVPGDLADPHIIALLQTHVATATADMPRESCHALDVGGLQKPELTFWAVWEGDSLLGVGALKDLGDGEGEVKSMHVAAAARGRGVGSAIVAHILATARARGYRRLYLETGGIPYFAPARALYAAHGFVECAAYRGYVPDPNSVFMTLELRV